MNPEIDENLLTAYALGELSGAERTAVAARLVNDAEARQFVEEVRFTASRLCDELSRESFGGLSDLQRAAIEHELLESPLPYESRRRRRRVARWNGLVLGMSVAASVLIVLGTLAILVPFLYRRAEQQARIIIPIQVVPQPAPMASRTQTIPPSPIVEPPENNPENNAFASQGLIDDLVPPVQWVPEPDDRLMTRPTQVDLSAADMGQMKLPNPPQPKRVVAVTGSGNQASAPRDQAFVAPPGPPATSKNRDSFAELPVNKSAPEKTPGDGDAYAHILENPFVDTLQQPVSGFAAGVDTASYTNIRRFLTHNQLPPTDAVRIEEMLNYFPVHAAPAVGSGDSPLAVQIEIGACPWRPQRRLARVCVAARELLPAARPPVNLVLVVDVSKSMRGEKTKLPLIKLAIRSLAGKMTARDRIAIVAYSHEAGIVLPPTQGDAKAALLSAVDRIESLGQTRGGQRIEVAYDLAASAHIPGGIDRVILATDGDWSVGATDSAQLPAIVHDRAGKGISLTVLGVGMTNLKDETLQKLAESGSGSYAYIDTADEARKILADHVNGALASVARDVKVQVAFNPAVAQAYRLIGYERRTLSSQELLSQSRHGGELGAGQSVTALYEVIVANGAGKISSTHPSDLLTTTVLYADPRNGAARSLESVGEDHGTPVPRMSSDFRFAASVAEFGLLLRDSDYKGSANWSHVLELARLSAGPDDTGYRHELVALIKRASQLAAP